jgi:hypothetical protein
MEINYAFSDSILYSRTELITNDNLRYNMVDFAKGNIFIISVYDIAESYSAQVSFFNTREKAESVVRVNTEKYNDIMSKFLINTYDDLQKEIRDGILKTINNNTLNKITMEELILQYA